MHPVDYLDPRMWIAIAEQELEEEIDRMDAEAPFAERYPPAILRAHHAGAQASAAAVVPLLLAAVPGVQSVVDVGCGLGTWLAECRRWSISDVLGIDGPWVPLDALAIPVARFKPMDLQHPTQLLRKYNLALCLEVAEHLPAAAADGLVSFLCQLAPVIFFSAAYPGQGGHYHVNEQPPSYWRYKFAQQDYLPEPLPGLAETGPEVQFWYRNGYLLRRREDAV